MINVLITQQPLSVDGIRRHQVFSVMKFCDEMSVTRWQRGADVASMKDE